MKLDGKDRGTRGCGDWGKPDKYLYYKVFLSAPLGRISGVSLGGRWGLPSWCEAHLRCSPRTPRSNLEIPTPCEGARVFPISAARSCPVTARLRKRSDFAAPDGATRLRLTRPGGRERPGAWLGLAGRSWVRSVRRGTPVRARRTPGAAAPELAGDRSRRSPDGCAC